MRRRRGLPSLRSDTGLSRPRGNQMTALLICDVCHAQLELSVPDVVAAAEVATFAEVHSDHEKCAFTLNAAGSVRTLTYGTGLRPRRAQGKRATPRGRWPRSDGSPARARLGRLPVDPRRTSHRLGAEGGSGNAGAGSSQPTSSGAALIQ